MYVPVCIQTSRGKWLLDYVIDYLILQFRVVLEDVTSFSNTFESALQFEEEDQILKCFESPETSLLAPVITSANYILW